jgi:hypothetical protein
MGYKVICRGGELVQNTLHAMKELSQRNPLVLLMFDNKYT